MQLRGKLILIFLLVSLIPIIGMSTYFFMKGEQTHGEQIMQDLNIAAHLAENSVQSFFDLQETRLSDWSSDGYLRSEMEAIAAQPSRTRADALGDYIRTRKMPLDSDIMVTDILDLSGRIVVSTRPERIGLDEGSTLLNFAKAKSARFGHSFMEPMEMGNFDTNMGGMGATTTDPLANEHFFHVLTPLVAMSNNTTIGVMLNHLDYKTLDASIGSMHSDATTKSIKDKLFEVYVVMRDTGLMMTSSRYVPDAIFKQKVDTEPTRACASDGSDFSGMYRNYVGEQVIGSSACPPGQWWTLVIEMKEKEAMADYDVIRLLFIIVVIITALLAIGTAILFSRPLLVNIDRIARVLAEIGKGNFDARVEAKGPDEIASIGRHVDSLAESLKILLSNKARADNAATLESEKAEAERIERIHRAMDAELS